MCNAPVLRSPAALLGVLCLSVAPASAQEAAPGSPPVTDTAPLLSAPLTGLPPAPAPAPLAAPTPVVVPSPPPVFVPPSPPVLPEDVVRHFRAGRVLYGLGTATGLIGGGLTIASIGLAIAYGTSGGLGDVSRGLAYAGSASSGVSVIFGAIGLGMQHSALARVGQDTGRGLYGVGTFLGVLGLGAIGASYYIDAAKPVENPEKVAFAVSVAATTLLVTGGILYFADERRMYRVYRRLLTF
jgi:hypothetical protein